MPALIGGFGNNLPQASQFYFLDNFSKSSNCSSLNLYTQLAAEKASQPFEKEDSSIDI